MTRLIYGPEGSFRQRAEDLALLSGCIKYMSVSQNYSKDNFLVTLFIYNTFFSMPKLLKDVVDSDPGVDALLLPADHFKIVLRDYKREVFGNVTL